MRTDNPTTDVTVLFAPSLSPAPAACPPDRCPGRKYFHRDHDEQQRQGGVYRRKLYPTPTSDISCIRNVVDSLRQQRHSWPD